MDENTQVTLLGGNKISTVDGVIIAESIGDQTGEITTSQADYLIAAGNKLHQEGKKALVLFDVTKMGKTTVESRRLVAKFSHEAPIDKAGIVGGKGTLKAYGQNLILRAVGMKNYRYFETKDQALAWLKQP